MKLVRLELRNFRQWLECDIDFIDGVTALVGQNGSGKTTVLEAIGWALYGNKAAREDNSTIRSYACTGGAKASVVLSFELSKIIYKVTRILDASGKTGNAMLEVDGTLIKSGTSEVTDAVTKVLQMDHKAFFNSFFTEQKNLGFMSNLDSRNRAATISKMLGYERLTKARDNANEEKKYLAKQIEVLMQGLPDIEELKQKITDAKDQLKCANEYLLSAEKNSKEFESEIEKLKPEKELMEQKSKRFEDNNRSVERLSIDIQRISKELASLVKEKNEVQEKAKEFESYREAVQSYLQNKKSLDSMLPFQRYEIQKQSLNSQIGVLKSEITASDAKITKCSDLKTQQIKLNFALEQAAKVIKEKQTELQNIKDEIIAVTNQNKAHISQCEITYQSTLAKRSQIEKAGVEGICPTCERPLAGEQQKVLEHFDAELKAIEKKIDDINKIKLTDFDAKVVILEKDISELSSSSVDLQKQKTEIDSRVILLDNLIKETQEKKEKLKLLSNELELIPSGFNQEEYSKLQQEVNRLYPTYERAITLKAEIKRQPELIAKVEETEMSLNQKLIDSEDIKKSLESLDFNQSVFNSLIEKFNYTQNALNASLIELERCKGELKTTQTILTQAEQDEAAYKLKIKQIQQKKTDRLYAETIADAMDKLRIELNDRIRPELEAIASDILSTTTDGRYNVLRIDENYKATIIDDNEPKPVISGGEEDIVNLCLRLAISQMIAERAGQQFSLLILDEVFGSLDEIRRDNVISLLQSLKNRFEQIILITHIDSIHDAVDNCLWVEFDEKNKSSRLVSDIKEYLTQAG